MSIERLFHTKLFNIFVGVNDRILPVTLKISNGSKLVRSNLTRLFGLNVQTFLRNRCFVVRGWLEIGVNSWLELKHVLHMAQKR